MNDIRGERGGGDVPNPQMMHALGLTQFWPPDISVDETTHFEETCFQV